MGSKLKKWRTGISVGIYPSPPRLCGYLPQSHWKSEGRVSTVWVSTPASHVCVDIYPSHTEKMKDGYRQCGYLPQPPTSVWISTPVTLKKWRTGIDSVGIYPSPPRLGTTGIWLFHMCDMTHGLLGHDSCICVTWLIHTCDMIHGMQVPELFEAKTSRRCTSRIRRVSDSCCDMTHGFVWHESLKSVTWLLHTCDMTHGMQVPEFLETISRRAFDSFTCVTFLDVHLTLSHVWHD